MAGQLMGAGGTLPEHWWAATPACIGRPDFQLHRYNSDLYILRQTACSHAEKPFLYLLFGRSEAILLDTGAEGGDVTTAVDKAVRHWLRTHDRRSIPLVVTHLHSHHDHIAGIARRHECIEVRERTGAPGYRSPTRRILEYDRGARSFPAARPLPRQPVGRTARP